MELQNTKNLMHERCISPAKFARKHQLNRGSFYRILSGKFEAPVSAPNGEYYRALRCLRDEGLLCDAVEIPEAV
jgi:predicted transcriptional regulator